MARQSRGLRLFGHPVHPMVAGFPLALWVGGTIWDLAGLFWPELPWSILAYWTLVLGLVMSIPAFVSGFAELISLPDNHPGERIAWWHMSLMCSAFGCFLASVLMRRNAIEIAEPADRPEILLALLGTVIVGVGGWLGGELVFRHGVAVKGGEESE